MDGYISELSRKEREAIKKRHEAMGKPVITRKEFETMKRTESGITGTMITLRTQLNQLEKEIKADRKGIRDFDMTIERLRLEADALLEDKKKTQEWCAEYDRVIGPMQMTYGNNITGIQSCYENAKDFHGKGIDLLKKEFNYNPAFKKHGHEFHAIPFRPK